MPATPDDLFAFLADLGIATVTAAHAPVFTVEEARAVRGASPGAHTKNLFLRDGKRRFFLVTLDEEAVVDLKRLRHAVGARGGLSFGSPDALYDLLGMRPGAVSPFAALNDAGGAVAVFVQDVLLEAAAIHCHPLANDRTTAVAPADLLAFLRATGHEPGIVSLAGD